MTVWKYWSHNAYIASLVRACQFQFECSVINMGQLLTGCLVNCLAFAIFFWEVCFLQISQQHQYRVYTKQSRHRINFVILMMTKD